MSPMSPPATAVPSPTPVSSAAPPPRVLARAPFERAVLDALPLTVWTVDLDGRLTSINRSWARFAADNGAPALADVAQVAGRSVWDSIADDESREELERAMRTLLEGRAPVVRWEFPCNSPDEERVFLMQLSPLSDGATDGGATGGEATDGSRRCGSPPRVLPPRASRATAPSPASSSPPSTSRRATPRARR